MIIGNWKEGKLNGSAIVIWDDGKKELKNWLYGIRHGKQFVCD